MCPKCVFTLEAMLQVAVTHRLLPENPAKEARYSKEQLEVKQHRVLSYQQYRWLLDKGCNNLAERTFIRMMCEAGLRNSEMVALRIGDLDLDESFINIQRRAYRKIDGSIDIDLPKSHKPRWAAINQSLTEELRQHIATLEDQSQGAPVWTRQNRYTNDEVQPLTPAASAKLIKTIATRSGIVDADGTTWISPHVLRKTGASLAVTAGVSPHIAQKQLGHARIETTTRHYLHLPMKEPLRQIGAVFD